MLNLDLLEATLKTQLEGEQARVKSSLEEIGKEFYKNTFPRVQIDTEIKQQLSVQHKELINNYSGSQKNDIFKSSDLLNKFGVYNKTFNQEKFELNIPKYPERPEYQNPSSQTKQTEPTNTLYISRN